MKEYKQIIIVEKNSSDETNLIVDQDELIDISNSKRSDLLEIKRGGCLNNHAMYLATMVKGYYVKWYVVKDSKSAICLVPVKDKKHYK